MAEVPVTSFTAINYNKPLKNPLELVNRKCVTLHYDKAKVHIFFATQQRLKELRWNTFMHLPYCLSFALPDYFSHCETLLMVLKKRCKSNLSQFFARKTQTFT